MMTITHQPIPSSEFRHIDRTDDQPIAQCALCRVRLAFQHYYGVPVCFCCQYNLSDMAPYHVLQGTSIALSLVTHELARTEHDPYFCGQCAEEAYR